MSFFWIGIAILYCIIILILHKLFYKEVRGDNQSNKRLWKIWGIQTAYWQGLLLVALGILAVILIIAKWANLLPNVN